MFHIHSPSLSPNFMVFTSLKREVAGWNELIENILLYKNTHSFCMWLRSMWLGYKNANWFSLIIADINTCYCTISLFCVGSICTTMTSDHVHTWLKVDQYHAPIRCQFTMVGYWNHMPLEVWHPPYKHCCVFDLTKCPSRNSLRMSHEHLFLLFFYMPSSITLFLFNPFPVSHCITIFLKTIGIHLILVKCSIHVRDARHLITWSESTLLLSI